MENTYWKTEEFEDLVSRSLIAMYETKYKKDKWAVKVARLTPDILQKIRSIGCYFAPRDRIVVINENEIGTASKTQEIDILNDGRPKYAIMCHAINSDMYKNSDDMRKDSYLEITFLENIKGFPYPIKTNHAGKTYRTTKLWMRNNFLEGSNFYNTVDAHGKIHGTYWIRKDYNQLTNKCKNEKVCAEMAQSSEESLHAEDFTTLEVAATIQSYQDRKHLWNVTANEGIAKATFGVYPEEIKSLFYARSLPMTDTGRKRPILHWVASHQRRISSGTDIDIEKHLRGSNEFIYKDTKFTITRPIKNQRNA